MHIQQKFQQKDPHFFGIVVKINPSGYIETTDYFRLTRSGLKAVKKCVSTSRQAPDSNHPSCLGKDLYESIENKFIKNINTNGYIKILWYQHIEHGINCIISLKKRLPNVAVNEMINDNKIWFGFTLFSCIYDLCVKIYQFIFNRNLI